MTIFDVSELKEDAIYPKLQFRDKCMKLLKDAEASNEEWIAVGQKAPSDAVLTNILTKRTELKNPLWMKELQRGLGYNSIKEMIGQ